MRRQTDLDTFYALLANLGGRFGTRRLGECHGRMSWPERGVYFFFEPGEHRNSNPMIPRVVRVGTHALIASSRTTLWNRLSQHRGTSSPPGGNHRGSIFRLLAGEALLNRNTDLNCETWGRNTGAKRDTRLAEKPVELEVSTYLGCMTVVFWPVLDNPGSGSARAVIERNSIALLSSYLEPNPDAPSADWLGLYSSRDRVRRSDLWNNNHVDECYDPTFLSLFEKLVMQA